MRRLVTLAVLPALVFVVAQLATAQDFKTSKQALQALNDYVGAWNLDGKSGPNKKKESWQESVEWGWKFKGEDAWMVMKFKGSKAFKSGEARYDLKKKHYVFDLVDAADKKTTYTGNIDGNYLVLEGTDASTKDTKRVKMAIAGDGIRLLYNVAVKPEGKTIYSVAYDIAGTREGESLSAGQRNERECVVSGGLGTGTVSYMGKTYWVCCSGCRDAFAETPKFFVDAFEAKRKKK